MPICVIGSIFEQLNPYVLPVDVMQMGRFDEAAEYEKEKKVEGAAAPTAGVSNMQIGDNAQASLLSEDTLPHAP